ncbi:alpha/beta fold hydrolase [Blattabacterium cuenoti]|uniref:alpha/beta fold hydrolase n=1 Tax=Blattabacterium cuenoti TaxID=1653831 RepID=UPI00163D0744|nr:alpha/beta fold hydrolase [Blattabacterium cuenoti]
MLKNHIFYKKNINFIIKGEGVPIVLLHGFMESLEIWHYIYQMISKKYKVVSIDLPGHGKNSFSEKKYIFSMEETAEIIKFFLDEKKIEQAIFVGHSMGGYIALALAEKYPNMFLGLCLLHSTADSDTEEKKKNRIKSIQLAVKNYPLFISTSINKLFNPKKILFLQKEISFVKKIALSTSINSVIPFLRGMSMRKNRKFLLKKYDFPKLYIIGLYDLILDSNKINEEAKNGNKTYSVNISTGHMGHIENPVKIIKILEDFIKNIL